MALIRKRQLEANQIKLLKEDQYLVTLSGKSSVILGENYPVIVIMHSKFQIIYYPPPHTHTTTHPHVLLLNGQTEGYVLLYYAAKSNIPNFPYNHLNLKISDIMKHTAHA